MEPQQVCKAVTEPENFAIVGIVKHQHTLMFGIFSSSIDTCLTFDVNVNLDSHKPFAGV